PSNVTPPVTVIAFVVGPTDPATNRGFAGVLSSSAACRANSAARLFNKSASAPNSHCNPPAPPRQNPPPSDAAAAASSPWLRRAQVSAPRATLAEPSRIHSNCASDEMPQLLTGLPVA